MKEEYMEQVDMIMKLCLKIQSLTESICELDRLFLPTAHIVWCVLCFPLTHICSLMAPPDLESPYLSIFWAMSIFLGESVRLLI